MIAHDDLSPVGDKDLRHGDIFLHDGVDLLHQFLHIESDSVSDNARCVVIKNSGRKGVQGKFAVVIDDSVTGIGTALKTDDNVSLLGKHIRDFSLAFISPVRSYYCCNHIFSS